MELAQGGAPALKNGLTMSIWSKKYHHEALAEHAEWEWHFNQVTQFVQGHGHHDLGSHPAGEWLAAQQLKAAEGRLAASRRERLEQLGIPLPTADKKERKLTPKDHWEAMYLRLDAWHKEQGHCRVPPGWVQDPELADWVARQRQETTKHKLTKPQRKKLDALGFYKKGGSGLKDDLWEQRWRELVVYQSVHGHTNVTMSQNRKLGHWRDVQRQFRRKGMLSEERIARLDGIGFEWRAPDRAKVIGDDWREALWEKYLSRLLAFRERFGHTQVPQHWEEDEKLATWVSEQRKKHRQKGLLPEREAKLTAIGFAWTVKIRQMPRKTGRRKLSDREDALWDQRYAELVAFYRQHGHCRVPNKQPAVEKLCKWCYTQRRLRAQKNLRADREASLDELGFRWDATEIPGLSYEETNEHKWERQFQRLAQFKEQYGHCHVPAHWKEDK